MLLIVVAGGCDGGSKPPDDDAPPGDSGTATSPTEDSAPTDSGTPTDTTDTGTPPEPDPCVAGVAAVVEGVGYPSVAYGIAAAPANGIVEVCPGDWPANLRIVRDVTLRGRGSELECALDGQFLDRVLTVEDAYLTLERITVKNGYVDGNGGGVSVVDSRAFVARHARFLGNEATGGGGGIYASLSPVHLYGVEIADNVAAGGGGVYVEGWSYSDDDFTAFRVDIHDNYASWGGGMYNNLSNSGSWFFASTIHHNAAEYAAGITYTESEFLLSDLSDNTATVQYGAGFWGAELLGGTVSGNTAPVDPDFAEGTTSLLAVQLNGQLVSTVCERDGCRTLEPPRADATWTPTEETGGGDPVGCETGAAAIVGGVGFLSVADAAGAAGDGGVVDVCSGTWPANLLVTSVLTLRGTAGADAVILDGDGLGSVIEVDPRGALTIEGLTLSGGYGDQGGGLFVQGSLDAVGLVVRDNLASTHGGGIAVYDTTGAVQIRASRIYRNAARDYGGGLYVGLASGGLDLTDTLFASNVAERGGGVALSTNGDGVEIGDVTFWGNAANSGGGLSFSSPYDTLRCGGCILRDNTAVTGGGLYAYGSVALSGGEVVGNRADVFGGAALVRGTLVSESVDWGDGADDNATDDVGLGSATAYAAAPDSFTCDYTAGTCG